MRRSLVASTMAALPVLAHAQTVNLNLGSVSDNGGPAAFNEHLNFGGYETQLPTGESEVYEPQNVSTGPNGITLTADPNGTSGAITSGTETNGMPTAGGFSFTNGSLQITATMPAGADTWPALWLEPVNTTAIPSGVSCEEDLIEAPFNDPNKYQATSHAGAGGQFVVPINNLAATHTYGINISPSTITFTLDANAVGSVPNTPACANQPMYLLANIAIGGWASNYANGQSSLPATMVISQIAYTGSSASGGLIGGAAAATAAVTGAASDPPPAATAAADPPAAASPAPAASAGTKAQTATTQITPGNGSVTDCAGNVWSISPDNKTLENGVPVLGGGDTSALTMDNSVPCMGSVTATTPSQAGSPCRMSLQAATRSGTTWVPRPRHPA